MTALSLLLLALAVVAYSVSQLALHSKLKWSKGDDSFWGEESYYRKYANPLDAPKDSWYTSVFVVKYKERFLFSSTFLIFLTDGYHLMQFLFLIFISLSVACAIGFSWLWFIGIWLGIHAVHFLTYRLLQR